MNYRLVHIGFGNMVKMRIILTSVAIAVGGFAIMASLIVGEGAR